MKLVSAEWCSGCKVVKNFIDEKGLDIDVVDADEQPDFVQSFRIRSLPALVSEDSLIATGATSIISELKKL